MKVFYLGDHLAAGLGSFSVSGSFPFQGEDSLSGGAVLQRELADDPTEAGDFNVPHRGRRLTQEQQEGVEPGGGDHSQTRGDLQRSSLESVCTC